MDTAPCIRLTRAESTPGTLEYQRPAPGAPNVVMIVLDDLGFAQLGCFGSDIETPHLDRLAYGGLRYNRFHVTSVCSSTRACLLTGRNHHAVGMGMLPDLPMGYPGYTGRLPKSAATVARVLRDAGWATRAIGKWHLTPRGERTAAGPFDRWPLGVGFEGFYGFLGGATNQWTPDLMRDNHQIEQPYPPPTGYHVTEDLAGEAIRSILDVHHAAPQKPFFLYFATGAMHSPHQVADQWIEPYGGRFDDGWERWRERAFAKQLAEGIVPEGTTLTSRPPWVQAWDDLSTVEREVFARSHEVFAGFLAHTDAQIGRIIDFLALIGQLDNTLLMVLSDNGASAEGGPTGQSHENLGATGAVRSADELVASLPGWGGTRTYSNYPWGWAWAGNSPLRLWKRWAWLGGTRTPLIVHWPSRIRSRGEIRSQFAHAVDLMPTILDVCGLDAPDAVDGVDQQRVDGASLRETFDDAQAPAPRDIQYFEMIGSRSIYRGGWKATTDHVPVGFGEDLVIPGSRQFATDRWLLFDLEQDFSEANDVAEHHPGVLEELQDLWSLEAERNQVLPLDDDLFNRFGAMLPIAHPPASRRVFRPGGAPVPFEALPVLAGGFSLLGHVEVPPEGAAGVLCAIGDWISGLALYAVDGRLTFALGRAPETYRVVADVALQPGRHEVGCVWMPDGATDGVVTFVEDAVPIAEGRLGAGLPSRWSPGERGLRVGSDRDFPVSDDYEPPFAWTGTISHLVLDASPNALRPFAEDLEDALGRD